MASLKMGKKEKSIDLGMPEELKEEMDKGSPKPANVESGEEVGDLKVTFDQSRKNRSYIVKQEGKIIDEREASQIVDIMKEGKLLVTAGGDIIKSNITEGTLFDKADITDEFIKTGGIRKSYDNFFIGKNGKIYRKGYDDELPICISDAEGSILKGRNIVDIEGWILKDSEGNVYVWGNNEYNQLGVGIEEGYSNMPICINTITNNELKGKKIRKVISENGFKGYITEDNECYINVWEVGGD